MNIDKNLQFITDKILDTRVALLHCYSNSILKLPNTIINTSEVDEHGNIWFFMRKPAQLLSQFEQEFPISLNYFKKGNNYSLQVQGKAQMINDDDALPNNQGANRAIGDTSSALILFRVKIIKVDFFELEAEKNLSVWGRMKYSMRNLLHWAEPDARSFDFGSATSLHNYGM